MPDERDHADRLLESIDKANAAKEAAAKEAVNVHARFLLEFQTLKARVIIPTLSRYQQKTSTSVKLSLEEEEDRASLTIVSGDLRTIIAFFACPSRQEIKLVIAESWRPESKWYMEPSGVTAEWVSRMVENALEWLSERISNV